MKRTLALSLILAALLSPIHAAEWNSSTSGDQTVAENVTVTDTANVGNITFTGDSVVSGSGSIGGSGNITVNSGTVVFDGVSRPNSTGNITIASGATLEIKNGAKLLTNGWHNASSVVTVNGTLKVEALNYGGSLGNLHDNIGMQDYTESLVVNGGGRVEITESGSASIGARLNGWGAYFTFAVADGKSFSWEHSTNGRVLTHDGAGSVLVLEAGEGATFTLGKNIGTGLSINKNGAGTLVLNSTLNLDGGRRININSGTVKFGDSARITSAGDGFFVNEGAAMDLEGKGGLSGLSVTVNGAVVNGQNNNMNLSLGSTGTFSISDDATSGYSGSIVLAEGAEVDLGDYIFYNTIDISAGGSLLNASNHRGTVVLGVDDEGMTYLDSDTLVAYSSSLASTGSVAAELTQDFVSESPDFELLKGRLYADGAISIAGTGEESVTIDGYTTEFGAVSAQGGDIDICDVLNVTLSNNAATNSTTEDWIRAGALSSTGAVSIAASGDVVISGNSNAVNSTSAGAIYASGGDLTIEAASITVENNTTGTGAGDDFSGGALRSSASIYLTSTEGDIVIAGNTADYSGGALYAEGGVEVASSQNVSLTGNTAELGDGGAIYSLEDVVITPGEGGAVSISDNKAELYGGAIYSAGSVSLSGGPMEISGNTAGSGGGAIYAEGDVNISADAGDIIFSGNQLADGTANDIELWGGSANLSATSGYTLELQGGITYAGEISITTDADSAVKLGGPSSTESFSISEGRLVGIAGEDGTPATINVSTAVTLNSACLQDVFLVDEYSEAALTSTASTYVYNDATAMLFEELDGAEVCCTSSAPLLNGFASVSGDLTIDLSYDFLQAALEASGGVADIALTLMADTLAIEGEDGFTFSLSENTLAILDASVLESYGLYNEEGTLLDVNTLTLYDAGTVILRINDLSYVIPEPATTTLSLLALSALSLRRRRR